jgi:hypothetical protein
VRDVFLTGQTTEFGMFLTHGTPALRFVQKNAAALLERGIYEETLCVVFFFFNCCETSPTPFDFSLSSVRELFKNCDRAKLLAMGEPLPAGESFRLYRGVAGEEPHRKVRGMSWTRSLGTAARYALDGPHNNGLLHRPAVYTSVARRDEILLHVNLFSQDEFVFFAERLDVAVDDLGVLRRLSQQDDAQEGPRSDEAFPNRPLFEPRSPVPNSPTAGEP